MKKRIAFFVCALLLALIIVFNHEAADAARRAFSLWQNILLPALLPFFVCARVITACGAFDPADPVVLFTLSFVSGAPSGAKLCASCGIASDTRSATPVAASLNTLSPVFVCGAYCADMLEKPVLAVPLITAQLVSSIVFFAVAMRAVSRPSERLHSDVCHVPQAKLFVSAVTDAVGSLLSICGMVVFFSVVFCIMRTSGVLSVVTFPIRILVEALGGKSEAVYAALAALTEVASGADVLASSGIGLRANVALSAFAFSFGGLCVAAQSMLFIPLELGRYVLYKLAQGACAALIAYLLFPVCSAYASPVSLPLSEVLGNTFCAALIFAVSLFSMSAVMLMCALRRRLPHKKRDGSPSQ